MKFDLNYLKEFIFQFTCTAQLIVNFSDFKILLYINMQFHFFFSFYVVCTAQIFVNISILKIMQYFTRQSEN